MKFLDKWTGRWFRGSNTGENRPLIKTPEKKKLTQAEREKLQYQLENLLQTVKNHPEDPEGFYRLSELYRTLGRYKEAIGPLKDLLRLDPQHPSAEYNIAQCYLETGRDDEAIELLNKVREKNPESPVLLSLLAQAYTNLSITQGKLKRYEESAEYFDRAVGVISNFGPAHLAMGKSLVQQGRYKEAIEKFKETLAMDPLLGVEANHQLGIAQGKLGFTRKAIKHFNEAIKINPKSALVHQDLGLLYFKQGNFEEAVHSLTNAVTMSPRLSTDAFFKLGLAHIKQKRFDLAEEPLRKAHEMSPENHQVQDAFAETLYRLALVWRKRGEPAQGVTLLKEAVRANPTHARAQYALSQLYDLLGESKQAIRHMLFAKNFFLDKKDRDGLAKSVQDLDALFKKYKAKPEDYDDLVFPERI